jgi:hypothetical protein
MVSLSEGVKSKTTDLTDLTDWDSWPTCGGMAMQNRCLGCGNLMTWAEQQWQYGASNPVRTDARSG